MEVSTQNSAGAKVPPAVIANAAKAAKPRIRVKANSRAAMSMGMRNSYTGASQVNSNLALWRPPLKSADADIRFDADKVRARARDLRRNHPYAAQAVRASRLGVIGKKLRYSCRPDFRFLGIDQDEAMRWAQEFERIWDSYAHSLDFSVDAGRRLNFTQKMALAHDSLFVDGEVFEAAEWNDQRKWKTCFQSIDIDRLSNPNGRAESLYLKNGIELDRFSAPIAYHVRDGHPSDTGYINIKSLNWTKIARETAWGRPIGMHFFEIERAGQTRGISAFAPVISSMKMGAEYTETALQQSILQASYAAVLTSQQNYKDALEIIDGMGPDEATSVTDLAEENLEAAMEHHERISLRFNGASIPVLWPGEDLKMLSPGQGATSLGEFQAQSTKSYAAGTGTDPIQVSQDYSQVNYSSAKMAAATSYRHYEARRELLTSNLGMKMVASFLEESVFYGGFALPKGVSPLDFYEARDALIRGKFLTQGAPILDPVKESQGQQLRLQMGTETLQDIAAEQGRDYIDVMDQQQREQAERRERGLGDLQAGPQPNALPGNGKENGAVEPDDEEEAEDDHDQENSKEEKVLH